MTGPNQITWTSAARCHVGLVRDVNEDAFLDRPERALWAVADGMGGHDAGDLASGMVVAALDALPPETGLTNLVTAARDRLQDVNRRLRAEALMRSVSIIGSTVVALIACERSCAYLWAGDSRIYLYRSGRLTLLSRDHSTLEELRARGFPVGNDAQQPGHNLITRAVGAVDVLELDQGAVVVGDGDMFLLCSDGLSNLVSAEEIGNTLASGDCRQACDTLVDLALKGGGRDNITAIVIRAEDPDSSDMTLLNPAL
ncbi:PP2C family protein-serine/threonine phosphatase [Aromatoleum petrolei]|uniref:SpoIIE family protein phosphatase n=1 Tax=Aromatoleum petrolei TaxID=76116 RepID=A0ABX1MPI7_9RHOO|nr:protein phosphatase 2C domain-containing protein [Aromatoleum petrolei]NMF89825.1 SpoIIE family protein phosphatase [Aromatoleum petrolei]QTQ35086.1 Putative phosphoprotein phosphatase [Aromatoleum petrolei]